MQGVNKNFYGGLKMLTPMVGEKKLYKTGKVPVFLPFYHLAADRKPAHIKHFYPVKSIQIFESEIDYIATHFQLIDANELIKRVKNSDWSAENKPIAHLSFDDGLTEVYDIIAPILKQKGIPATIFLNTAFLDDKDIFYRYRVSLVWDEIDENRSNSAQVRTLNSMLKQKGLFRGDLRSSLLDLKYEHREFIKSLYKTMLYDREKEKVYLTTEEVKQLISQGFTVGAHSIDHPYYNEIDLNEQKRQTRESIDHVVETFGLNYRLFSFPFTDSGVTPEFFEWLHAGNKPVADVSFGMDGLKRGRHPHHFQRVAMETNPSAPDKSIKSEYLNYYFLKIFGKH